MEKKSFWIVTKVEIGRITSSVNTYALRWFDSLNEAKSFVENESNRIYTLGYEPSKFTHSDMGWTYKDDFEILQVVISIAFGV